jgi:hypothetical protein
MTALTRGDRALLVGCVLTRPVVIQDVKPRFGGEPDPGVRIYWRHTAPGRERTLQSTDGKPALKPCPPGYELPPDTDGVADSEWFMRALEWLHRNQVLLTRVHGHDAMSLTEDHLVRRIIGCRRRDEALAREPDASAAHRTEIAIAALRGEPL